MLYAGNWASMAWYHTSSMQHLTGNHVAQDGPIGLAGSLPAELQGVRAEGSEHKWPRSTGCA